MERDIQLEPYYFAKQIQVYNGWLPRNLQSYCSCCIIFGFCPDEILERKLIAGCGTGTTVRPTIRVPPPSGFISVCVRVDCGSPVGCGACVPRWAFRHALSPVNDETVEIGEVDFGAELGTDAAPALKLVGAGWAVGHAASLVVVMHTCRTCCVTTRDCAAAQALGVATLAVCCAHSPHTLLWALWWGQRGEVLYPCR